MSEEIKTKPYNPNVIKSNWYISSGTRGCGKTQNIIQQLQQENRQLKDIIKEIKAYVMANCLYNFKYDEDELFEIITDEKASDELMEILDKVKE